MLDAMQRRYSVKKYADTKLHSKDLEDLKNILRLTPSSINAQPWRFVFVRDKETKAKLAAESYFNEEKILQADTLVIFQTMTEEYFNSIALNYIPARVYDYFQKEVTKRPGGYPAWASRQAYIAMGFLLSACAEKSIGSTPMEGIKPDAYDAIINDKNYHSIAAVSLGVPSEDDYNKPESSPKQRLPLDQVILDI
ncbi:NAD(P)H-dependent oxidoreductase [Flavobacteriaceae bacterium Ap0902]|nr:NAD(P)H-dependent oxidoreductase [Flavobacteriaceae bacterium Ap0902]